MEQLRERLSKKDRLENNGKNTPTGFDRMAYPPPIESVILIRNVLVPHRLQFARLFRLILIDYFFVNF